jgi:PKD repeat protein
MSRVSILRTTVSGTILLSLVAALLAAAVLGALAPAASAAAPVSPYFGPNVQVDKAPAYSAFTPAIAVGSGGVYAAFDGWGSATTQNDIFFTKSSNGRTWSVPVRVNNDALGANQAEPAIAVDGSNNIVIVWTDARNGNNDVFFAKSTDGGQSFPFNIRVNDVPAGAQSEPDVALDHLNPNIIHVVWTDTRNAGGSDIYYTNSTDGGSTFRTPNQRLNLDGAGGPEQSQPKIAVGPNQDVYAIWTDARSGGAVGRDIYFAKSTDRGTTWNTNIWVNDDYLTPNVAHMDPTIAVDSAGTIYAAWTDNRNSNTGSDIYTARLTSGGSTFTPSVRANDDKTQASQSTPSLGAAAGTIELAWMDSRMAGSTNWDIYAASSSDGINWSANVRVNDDNVNAFQIAPALAVDASRDVFVAWLDTRGPTADVYATVLDRLAPTAEAGSSATVDQGNSVSFNGSASTDNLGIASYAWDFGDGTSGAGATATHTYQDAGVYAATLTVWDRSGNAATATRTVTVRDVTAPVPRGGGDRAVEDGQPLFFDASASTDNVGVTSYLWDFGDGTTATTATATHVYGHEGAYTARLTATDAAGNAATSTFTVTVRPNSDLGLIQVLGGLLGVLAIVIAFLGWMLLGIRKKEQQRGALGPTSHGPSNPMPPPPPRDSDPLDMAFPPGPPKGP